MRAVGGTVQGRFRKLLFIALVAVLSTWCGPTAVQAEQMQIPAEEYAALVALYETMDGANWSRKWAFPTYTPCDLGYVECELGHVTGLYLANNNLTGTLPPEIGNLGQLEYLLADGNHISGVLTPQLCALARLYTLDLSRNQLTGGIPPCLGGMSSLRSLDLYQNLFTGPIPVELASLDLERLNLSHNRLTGHIPKELGSPANLGSLVLHDNQLTGPIPPELGALSRLVNLTLAYNQLTGTIPSELGDLVSLQVLYIGDNLLTGPIPQQLGRLSNMEVLNLPNNLLTGTIPDGLCSLGGLRELSVAGNDLLGPVHQCITGLTLLGVPDGTGRVLQVDFGHNHLWSRDSSVIAFLDAKDPDWASTQTVDVIPVGPGTSALLSVIDAAGGTITVELPEGAAMENLVLALSPLTLPSNPTSGHFYGGLSFLLSAYRDDDAVLDATFAQPVVVTITYSDAQIAGVLERTLTLNVWQHTLWTDAAVTCAPASIYVRQTDTDYLGVAICHLSEFALFGEPRYRVMLPLVTR